MAVNINVIVNYCCNRKSKKKPKLKRQWVLLSLFLSLEAFHLVGSGPPSGNAYDCTTMLRWQNIDSTLYFRSLVQTRRCDPTVGSPQSCSVPPSLGRVRVAGSTTTTKSPTSDQKCLCCLPAKATWQIKQPINPSLRIKEPKTS